MVVVHSWKWRKIWHTSTTLLGSWLLTRGSVAVASIVSDIVTIFFFQVFFFDYILYHIKILQCLAFKFSKEVPKTFVWLLLFPFEWAERVSDKALANAMKAGFFFLLILGGACDPWDTRRVYADIDTVVFKEISFLAFHGTRVVEKRLRCRSWRPSEEGARPLGGGACGGWSGGEGP